MDLHDYKRDVARGHNSETAKISVSQKTSKPIRKKDQVKNESSDDDYDLLVDEDSSFSKTKTFDYR